jgi:PKD repeat protein
MTKYITHMLVLLTAALAGGCTLADSQPPPLAGPSEMSLSLAITANPDVLSLDGSSQTLVTVDARDQNGQPAANVPLRVEIIANGQSIDFGSISARTLVTNSNGRASFTYTAPAFVTGTIPDVQIGVTPTGTDASSHIRRVVEVRLVPPGVITASPIASFSYLPANPTAFSDVRFDGSASTGGLGAVVTNYVWDFGDNSSGTGITATHRYSAAGTYVAKLTVTDSNGGTNQSAGQTIVVGGGAAPTADFIVNPASPLVGQTIFFNATTSAAGAGHSLVSFDWNFGDGSTKSGSTVSKSYSAAGNYTVVLTVTDEVGQTSQAVNSVTVGASAATAAFTYSPTNPRVGTKINLNGSDSKGEGTNTIVRYVWDFGCTVGTTCTPSATVTSSSPTASVTFTAVFTYTVRLTVTDSKGKTATTTQDLTIAP